MLYKGIIGNISISPNSVDVVWTMANFFALSEQDGAYYCSHHFFFRGERYSFKIYPNGSSECDSYGHVNVKLIKSPFDPFGASIGEVFSLSLRTAKGEKEYEKYGTKECETNEVHEFLLFIPRSELSRRRSELVPDGFLTFNCTLKDTPSAGSAREDFEQNSKNTLVESCTQTEEKIEHPESISVEVSTQTREENGEDLEQNSKNTRVESCTQTEEEIAENYESICVVASTQTAKENADEWFKEESRKACVEAFTQTEEQNEEINELSTAELNKANIPEVVGSDEAETSDSNQTGATKTNEPVSPINLPEKQDWLTDVSDFLKDGRGVDVTFELDAPNGKTEFIAHQLILALRSPYFADKFYGKGLNKGHLIVSLKGIEPKAFEQMIRYCYDYKLCLRSTEDACVLFKVASTFKVLSLQQLCRTFIRNAKIDPKNVFIVLEVSEQMEDKSLGDMCYKILQEKTRDVMANYDLCDVTSTMVHTILSLSKLSLNSEYELIKWICDWAKGKSEDEHSSSENARGCLERFLKDMNFLVLTMEEFATLCKDNPGLFSSDEIISIYQNIACPGTRRMPDWYENDGKFRVYTGLNE